MFRRVARYGPQAHLDPRENRLTEVTATALEHVDGLAAAFARCLLDLGERDARRRRLPESERMRRGTLAAHGRQLAQDRVDIETQLATDQGRYVDLEVLLRPRPRDPGRGLLIWVEVKHGADLHGDQVDAYLSEIDGRFPGENLERAVVVISPRGWEPTQVVPERALHADWQAFARELPAIAAGLEAPEQRWLLTEYIRYLKEESLSDPDALTVSSALALMQYEQAEEAAAGICEHADAHVTDHWGDRTNAAARRGGDPAHGLDYWANYAPHRRGEDQHALWQGTWFEWGLRYGPYMNYVDGLRGSYVFIAGASTSYAKDEPARRPGNETWMGRRQSDGFHRTWLDNYKLVRMRYPDELLAASTLDAQGRALGEWIVEAFEALVEDPPEV